ncbi:hypothetical protein L2X99_17090 [Microbacterium sp. KUDC0406]|uniref:hypothetical protein n=1 Tax=Microbacterium sp. KUDC0406 TaxID=2909588 RepID=UPI001F25E64A|nr:hypothetical protein [Microbacterium sp. KUDC0406]UJP10045.1 hypothetical protein L2X99_17090 [Microbacterium sp. KUDC0406]
MTIPAPPPATAAPGADPTAAVKRSHGRRFLRAAVPWTLSIAMVVAAWFLLQLQKPDDAVYDSFVTKTTVGEYAAARNLSATVTDVRAGRSVSDGKRWSAEGTWLVVGVDAATLQTEFASQLHGELRIGDRIYQATERGETGRNMSLITGVPRHGSLVFELPEGQVKGDATVVLSWQSDHTADGVIEVAVDLDDVPMQYEVTLDEIAWAR